MRSSLLVLVALGLGASLFGILGSYESAFGSEDGMRNDRMNACIRILRQNDKAIKNGWRGHCGVDELDQELASTPADAKQSELLAMFSNKSPIVVEDGPCGNAPTPVAETQNCGLARPNVYSSLGAGAAMRIRLPGNKCGTFIPLLLTNKNDFACNAVQTRIACVDVSYDEKTDRTAIKFSTRRHGMAETTSIEFGRAELAEHDGRISDLISHSQFTLVPASINDRAVAKTVLEATRSQEALCNSRGRHSKAGCAKLAQFQADANMQEVVRRYRNPRHDSPKEAIANDGKRIVEFPLKERIC